MTQKSRGFLPDKVGHFYLEFSRGCPLFHLDIRLVVEAVPTGQGPDPIDGLEGVEGCEKIRMEVCVLRDIFKNSGYLKIILVVQPEYFSERVPTDEIFGGRCLGNKQRNGLLSTVSGSPLSRGTENILRYPGSVKKNASSVNETFL